MGTRRMARQKKREKSMSVCGHQVFQNLYSSLLFTVKHASLCVCYFWPFFIEFLYLFTRCVWEGCAHWTSHHLLGELTLNSIAILSMQTKKNGLALKILFAIAINLVHLKFRINCWRITVGPDRNFIVFFLLRFVSYAHMCNLLLPYFRLFFGCSTVKIRWQTVQIYKII